MDDNDDPLPDWQVQRAGPGSNGPEDQERIARYRRHAADIQTRAASVTDPTTRQQLLDVATQYENLARSIERLRR